MMGHVCTLLVGMVESHHGAAGVSRMFKLSGVEQRQFRPEVIYPEEMFQALLNAAMEVYGVDSTTAQEAFAEYYMDVSPKMFPAIFKKAGGARALLEMVPLIHDQWPSAAHADKYQQKLWVESSAENRLVFKYISPNRLCGVLLHVAERVLTYYEEEGEVKELECMNSEAPACRVEVLFTRPNS